MARRALVLFLAPLDLRPSQMVAVSFPGATLMGSLALTLAAPAAGDWAYLD